MKRRRVSEFRFVLLELARLNEASHRMDARGVDARPIATEARVEHGEPIIEPACIGIAIKEVVLLRKDKHPVILDRIRKRWRRYVPHKQIRREKDPMDSAGQFVPIGVGFDVPSRSDRGRLRDSRLMVAPGPRSGRCSYSNPFDPGDTSQLCRPHAAKPWTFPKSSTRVCIGAIPYSTITRTHLVTCLSG